MQNAVQEPDSIKGLALPLFHIQENTPKQK